LRLLAFKDREAEGEGAEDKRGKASGDGKKGKKKGGGGGGKRAFHSSS